MATGLRFHGTVSEEMRELLRREYKEHAAKTAMTDDEHMALRKWVSQGNSPYGNPNCIADERGIEMDFLSGLRTLTDLAAETHQA